MESDEKKTEQSLPEQIEFLKTLDPEKEIAIFKCPVRHSREEVEQYSRTLKVKFPNLRILIMPADWKVETLTVEKFREQY